MNVDALYLQYADFVYRVCFRYTKTQEEAEDMTQEVFIKAGKNLEGFRGESQPSTWLYRMAIHGCIDHLRWKKRQSELSRSYLDEQVERNLASHGEAVAAKIDLERLLEPLSSGVRQVLFLHFAEGLDYEEVGKVLGLSSGAVANKILRFRERFGKNSRRQAGAFVRRFLRVSSMGIAFVETFFRGVS